MSDCHPSGVATMEPVRPEDGAESGIHRTVALVGPPNSGKSTLFNRLTGLRQKVANYPGVTVEKRFGRVRLPNGDESLLIDLPGVYSLTPRSEDERVTHDVLTEVLRERARQHRKWGEQNPPDGTNTNERKTIADTAKIVNFKGVLRN